MKREGSLRAVAAAWTMIAIAAQLAACAPTRGGPIAYDQTGFGRPDAVSAAVADAVYRVGPGDALMVNVLNVPEYSGEVAVDVLGQFEMPLIGKVPAVGKSTDEIARDLETKLGARYLRSPKVLVTVKTSQSARVTVDGSVTTAGVYPIVGKTSLLQALALAHGLKDDANPRRVVIFRTIAGQRQAAAFDLVEVRRGQAPDPEVFGNDVIVVDGSKSATAFKNLISGLPILSVFRPF